MANNSDPRTTLLALTKPQRQLVMKHCTQLAMKQPVTWLAFVPLVVCIVIGMKYGIMGGAIAGAVGGGISGVVVQLLAMKFLPQVVSELQAKGELPPVI